MPIRIDTPNYAKTVPEDSFLGRYLHHNANIETASDYDWWCGLWLMANACGRDIVVDRPSAPVFLNLYVILVAESGITRKSSAVRQAQRINQLFNESLSEEEQSQIIEGKCSTEQFDRLLHLRTYDYDRAWASINVSELTVFLGNEGYTTAMPALLTDVYDCPASRRGGGTLKRGPTVQSNVFVNLLSASTPAWLIRSVNPTVVQGGFTSRCMFVVSEKPKSKIAWPSRDDDYDERVAQLVEHMQVIRMQAKTHGTLSLNKGALQAFTSWYNRRQQSVDDYRRSFESREDAHILRIAAYLCINDGSWVIQHTHIQHAIRIIARVKSGGAKMFSGAQERNRFVQGIEAVRIALMQSGLEPIPRSKLYLRARFYVDYPEFQAMLDVMHEMGAIQRFEMITGQTKRGVELIRATRLLMVKNSAMTIMERIT